MRGTALTTLHHEVQQSQGITDTAEGQRVLGEKSSASHSSSPPSLGFSFGPLPEEDGQLRSQDVLQRMQALQQRAPLLYGYPPERPARRSNSSPFLPPVLRVAATSAFAEIEHEGWEDLWRLRQRNVAPATRLACNCGPRQIPRKMHLYLGVQRIRPTNWNARDCSVGIPRPTIDH